MLQSSTILMITQSEVLLVLFLNFVALQGLLPVFKLENPLQIIELIRYNKTAQQTVLLPIHLKDNV